MYNEIESDEDRKLQYERRETIAVAAAAAAAAAAATAASFFVKRPYVHRPRYYAVAPLRFPFG